MQRITPFLWFDSNAEEAVAFYTSIFKNSKTGRASHYGEGGQGPAGSVMVIPFEIDGQEFLALNGGAIFKFNESVSFVVNCETQDEIDYYWAKLTEGGKEVQCGWLKDKFGLSWQIVPTIIGKIMTGQLGDKVMKAVLKMIKIDLATIERILAEG